MACHGLDRSRRLSERMVGRVQELEDRPWLPRRKRGTETEGRHTDVRSSHCHCSCYTLGVSDTWLISSFPSGILTSQKPGLFFEACPTRISI